MWQPGSCTPGSPSERIRCDECGQRQPPAATPPGSTSTVKRRGHFRGCSWPCQGMKRVTSFLPSRGVWDQHSSLGSTAGPALRATVRQPSNSCLTLLPPSPFAGIRSASCCKALSTTPMLQGSFHNSHDLLLELTQSDRGRHQRQNIWKCSTVAL